VKFTFKKNKIPKKFPIFWSKINKMFWQNKTLSKTIYNSWRAFGGGKEGVG
jgi:hypothetical protein